jgi:integrase
MEELAMASIDSYTTKAGKKLWRFQVWTPADPHTGKKSHVMRQGFPTKSEAKLQAVRFEAAMDRHGFREASQLKFREVYESWFQGYQNTVKESTWAKTADNVRLHVLPFFGDKLLAKITPVDCQEAVNQWYKKGYTKYQTFLNLVSRVFQYAVRMDLVMNDPTKKVIVPRDRNKPTTTMENNYYDLDELKKFFTVLADHGDQQEFTFFRVLAFTGMRKGEALALLWSDVSFSGGTISITKTQTRGATGIMVNSPKTYNSIRVINVDKKTLAIMKKWQWQQRQNFMAYGTPSDPEHQLVFSTRYNGMIGPAQPVNWLDKLVETYDLKKITPHGFRHTYATLAFESGLTIKEVQKQLGHRSFQTTMDIYTAVTKKQQEQTAATFAKYVDM